MSAHLSGKVEIHIAIAPHQFPLVEVLGVYAMLMRGRLDLDLTLIKSAIGSGLLGTAGTANTLNRMNLRHLKRS
jgi:hypothetical protein